MLNNVKAEVAVGGTYADTVPTILTKKTSIPRERNRLTSDEHLYVQVYLQGGVAITMTTTQIPPTIEDPLENACGSRQGFLHTVQRGE